MARDWDAIDRDMRIQDAAEAAFRAKRDSEKALAEANYEHGCQMEDVWAEIEDLKNRVKALEEAARKE